MSATLDEDSVMRSIGGNDNDVAVTVTPQQQSAAAATQRAAGLTRSNSVKAKANMFQQLQEQSSGDQHNKPQHNVIRRSPPPAAASNSQSQSSIQMSAAVAKTLTPTNSAQKDESKTPNSTQDADEEFARKPKGILKSRSGAVGLMPIDLNAELKKRLRSSTHASVSNLRKSATTLDASQQLITGSDTSNSGGAPVNLAQILRNVTQENVSSNDAVSLVRNLSNLDRSRAPADTENANALASASEGESSGGREISAIIKNSAVARRRRHNNNDGGNQQIAKSKSHSALETTTTPATTSPARVAGIGPNVLPPLEAGAFVKLRHVETKTDANTEKVDSTSAVDQAEGEARNVEANLLPHFLEGGLKRCMTQVMGPDQRPFAIAKTGSIAERLAALQKSGEDDWKKRITKRDEVDEICRENYVNESLSLAHTLSDKQIATSPLIQTSVEGGKVAERLGKLRTSSENWKQRIEETDAKKFTVAGRLQKKGDSPVELQFKRGANDAAKKCPQLVIRSANQPQLGLAKSPSMMAGGVTGTTESFNGQTTNGHAPVQRSVSVNAEEPINVKPRSILNSTSSTSSSNSSDSDSDARLNEKEHKNWANNKSAAAPTNVGARIVVPRLDDEETFESFFVSKQLTKAHPKDTEVKVELSAFDAIKPTERLVSKRTVQGPKGRRAVPNPLKSLASRSDITSEYTEIKSGIAEREMKRIKQETIGQRSNFAAEAIAGLASVEDFKSVSLKSAALPLNQSWLPYKSLMLLHVKGRTHVQTRLVEPKFNSLNRGDCFILIAGKELFRYIGNFANVIEISRSKKICAAILENKDLGCNATQEVVLTDGKYINEAHWKKFWELLGKSEDQVIPDSGHADEDDVFESSLIETNKIYEFQDDALVPFKKYWGNIPKVEMLDSRKVLVFDFGSELYIWNGKNAPLDAKRAAIRLAREHFTTDAIDYSDCFLNPLNYVKIVGKRDSTAFTKRCEKREDWCILGKITQNMETVLFKEKFADWPEVEREDIEKDYLANNVCVLKAPDGAALYKGEPYQEPNMILENVSLGRGNSFYDSNSMRHYDIYTKSTDKWQILEYNFANSKTNNFAQFYSTESYIVRWLYQVSVTVRELSGKISNRNTVGRDRCVYFCWQGADASNNEKGAAALLTVELDKEKGSQLRVAQGEEPTAFLRLFEQLYQHHGSKEECLKRRKQWRLYQILGNLPEEMIVKEVECRKEQLRSRASMLFIHGSEGKIVVWHGCKSAPHTRVLAMNAAKSLTMQVPRDLFIVDNIEIIEQDENMEMNVFKAILPDLSDGYVSLRNVEDKEYKYSLRLFNFSSKQGVFKAQELTDMLRCKNLHSPYPFSQTQLYNARQPTIFLVDDGDCLWLWYGWWPPVDIIAKPDEELSLNPMVDNRAGFNRWISERRAALESAVSYWRAKYGANADEPFDGIKGYVVWAGLEPIEFKILFPEWKDRAKIRHINIEDGRNETPTPIATVLQQMTQTEYSLDVLRTRPLPEGVEPTRLELYLNPQDFQKALGMTRLEFDKLPLWKQTNLKKTRGLF